MNTIKSLVILNILSFCIFSTACERPVPDSRTLYDQEVKHHPFTVGTGGLYCDSPPYPDWHVCHTSEPLAAEHMRFLFSKKGWCSTINTNDADNAELSDFVSHMLTVYPDSCSREKIEGFDEAISKKFGPVLSAMKDLQGEDLPLLDSEQTNECKLAEIENWYGKSTVFEVHYRRCAYRHSISSTKFNGDSS